MGAYVACFPMPGATPAPAEARDPYDIDDNVAPNIYAPQFSAVSKHTLTCLDTPPIFPWDPYLPEETPLCGNPFLKRTRELRDGPV